MKENKTKKKESESVKTTSAKAKADAAPKKTAKTAETPKKAAKAVEASKTAKTASEKNVAPKAPKKEVVVEEVVDTKLAANDEVDEAGEESKNANRAKNYHISLREDGKWQVKLRKGEKALKLFDTQAQAIAYAKEKAKNQDGHITIHKVDGKIRKQRY